MGQILSTRAERRIMERLRRLPPQQLEEVIRFIDSVVERPQENTTVCEPVNCKHSIQALRGRGKGERLVVRLLESRREDREHDERK